ncbi:viral capsid associated protein [Choristoneura fumiferana DEF multiple nucleopolyhedrovirus]|uniref:Viral capsid associated protein n=1 Tax=Choristoneura fumiferana defective polyhedrosis virus TaxID=74660 RepID=Q6VTP3_NPVCD|nr:viral capsid associated protein [Choristoneura fumiferana DEF multiple nucleopolyhedrovirus]AAQ91642.1 viral capsid associated protein [Choristoneura fumiferana DEF multiple nucleopolyhedrovirus]
MDDEKRSLLIAKLAGQILTRDAAAVSRVVHTPERSLNEKLDTLQSMAESLPVSGGTPSNAARHQTNSIMVTQNYVLRYQTLRTALEFLRRASRIDVPTEQLDEIQQSLQQYEEYVNGDGSNIAIINEFLTSAESAYQIINKNKIAPFLELNEAARLAATTQTSSPRPTQTSSPRPTQTSSPTLTSMPTPAQTSMPTPAQTSSPRPTQTNLPEPLKIGEAGPSQTRSEKLYELIENYRNDPQAIERVKNLEIKNVLRSIVRNVTSQEVPFYKIRLSYEAYKSIKDKKLRAFFNLYDELKSIDFYTEQKEPLFTSPILATDQSELTDTETESINTEAESIIAEGPYITNESQFDHMNIDRLVDYVRKNYKQKINFDAQDSVDDVIEFAKNIWRRKNNVGQTPMHPREWQTPAYQNDNDDGYQTPIIQPQDVPLPKTDDETMSLAPGVKRRRKRVPPLPEYSSDDNDSDQENSDYETKRKRQREEDKNFLRLKALELSKYAGVNERMEKIVQVTRAMQQTYDYCNCKNTINGTPNANAFVNLLMRLNTYNLSHVEMTVNFYELLYPLTLYNDESNRIIGYIFAASNYFQNCAKNYERMRVEFNQYGPFVQLDSMVMFVIKFNFLCDLQTFFGKIDGMPALGQPNVYIHNVLVMRDKIVKLAFNSLQYNIVPKSENRRDPKHLQRLIMLMNGNFNIM